MKKMLVVMLVMLVSRLLPALEPPKPFEIEALKASGQLEKRQEFAKKLGNHTLKLRAGGESLPGAKVLPSIGNPKIFVLLVDFPDYPQTIDASTIQSMLFGEGNAANFPYESLRTYYERASYGKLHIEGDVYGWYRAAQTRDNYTNDAEGLIEEAIAYYHGQGARFDKYDNDGNGEVEYFAVFWTGPDEGWASFWWGWQGYFYDEGYKIDGKTLGSFSWQWEEDVPGTIIHETGHALGIPDYYDYDDAIGPRGGTGGLDMMDGVWGDHNAYSKWMLGWLTPQVVTSASQITLPPMGTNPSAVVMARDFDGTGYDGEFFMIQNRYRTGNDSDFPGDGFLIHHVDSRRDCSGDTLYNNSYTEHKLLRLMEADGLEEIEKARWGDEGDFYHQGNNDAFTPGAFPCSDFYKGGSSFVSVTGISAPGEQMSANFALTSSPDLEKPVVTSPQSGASGQGTTPEVIWEPSAGASGYELEVHEGVNTVYKSGTISAQTTSFSIPSGKLSVDRNYTLWLKAKGDGTASGSSEWAKTNFSSGCEGEPYFVANTFFDPPCFTYYAGFAYHPPTGKFVRFGGNGSDLTFEYDGREWKSYDTFPAPQDRYYAAMAYDPVNQKIVMFGGYNNRTGDVFGDTWLYDPATHTWEEMNPPEWPAGNWSYRAATDTVRNVVVIYEPSGKTWEWNGVTWNQTTTSGPGYYYANLAFDPGTQKTYYFGGYQDYTYVCKNETWEYDGQSWKKLSTSGAPDKRCDAVLVYNQRLQKIVLYGGSNEYYEYFDDLWSFDGSSWDQLSYCGRAPAGASDILGGYDIKRGRLVMAKASDETSTYELAGLGGACSPTLDPQSGNFTKAGGTGSFAISIGEGCAWTAESDSGWITLTSAAGGTGPATVGYSVAANSGEQRSGNISVGGILFQVTQGSGILPPQISSVAKLTSPFRLKINGSNFQSGIKVFFGEGSGKTEWTNFSFKNSSAIVLKGGTALKANFPKGNAVKITLENPDGGEIETTYTR